jgi:peptidoglycan-N-acetylglucosamine deacetylase
MMVVFLGQKQLRWGFLILFILIFTVGAFLNWDRIARRVVGVKPGVRLEGRLVSGLLPGEVAEVIREMAAGIEQEPRSAGYLAKTGEIIPAEPGKKVNVAENVNRVCLAKPNSNLRLSVQSLVPAVSEEFFKPVYHGNQELPRVALAINVAWGEELIPGILKILADQKVKATFFLVGTWVKDFPELTKTLFLGGHELANHGLYHGHPQAMEREELKKLIIENESLIASITGKKPINFFAPPYGELNSLIISTAGELGYRTIMWSVDSVDWKNPAPDILLNRVLSKVEPGGIILLHPTQVTKETLPGLIQSLRKRGLEPGTVSRVLQK